MRIRHFLSIFLLCLCLFDHAIGESLTVINSNQVTGELTVNGYTFAVDAYLSTGEAAAQQASYLARELDLTVLQAQLAALSPTSGAALFQQLDINQAAYTSTLPDFELPMDPLPATHPYTPSQPDDVLAAALQHSLDFCTSIDLHVSSVPLSCTYMLRSNGITLRILPEDVSSPESTFIEVWLLLENDGVSAVPHLQVPHYRGALSLNGKDGLLTQAPGARFYFSMDGTLLGFQCSALMLQPSDASPAAASSWEDALLFFLNDFTAQTRIQQMLQAGSYTVTSIRRAWDLTEDNTGSLGWLITLSSRVPSENSPLGWRNRHYTAFVEDN